VSGIVAPDNLPRGQDPIFQAVPLALARPPLEEVVVSTSRYPLGASTAGSPVVLDAAALQRLPALGDDSLRAVARLPGAAGNGLSARSHVRGGELDETLVRLDGLRLFDPFHLKDFQSVFSVIDPRLIQSMDVYTGGFPVMFGDRMSGVIDLDSRYLQGNAGARSRLCRRFRG
jgi:outer membrane receptor protein involved in Fe transport